MGHKEIFDVVNLIPISSTRECWRIKRTTGEFKLYKLRTGLTSGSIDACK